MEQHPVPQQISAYHFRLVGDMTIKQFIELAGGILIAWIIYSLPVEGIIRWPFVILSVFLGIALAFLPLEERPLDRWFLAFLKALYSPTKYIWKKKVLVPSFLKDIKVQKKPTEKKVQVDRSKLKEYLETLPIQGPQTAIDKNESEFISNIMNLYMEVQPTTASSVKLKQSIIEEERLPNIKVRKLRTPPLDPRAILRGEIIMPKRSQGKPKRIQIPSLRPTEVEKQPTTPFQQTEDLESIARDQVDMGNISPLSEKEPKPELEKPSTAATIRPELPIPSPPTQPNVLVGMVVDNLGNIIENAIVTIKDSQGNIARAQKTNKIGQFFIATPLKDGNYKIEIEGKDLDFDIMSIELTGKPVPPIEIRAKNINNELYS
jgi:hypothetical protein